MVPGNVSTKLAPRDTPWSKLTLADFTSKSWPDLTDAEKRHIAGHFAWAAEMPPAIFGDLKLGHHAPPSGAVVFAGVTAALGRLDQTQGLGSDKPAVQAHLEAHQRAFEAAKGFATLTRAYSTFEIKSVDEDQRIIEGIASSPATDRLGDILEPDGAKFTLPLPLLWQHRSDQPIGQVLAAKVTKAGIQIRAKIAKGLLPFIDEAWALIKAGLVRGLSVGFNPIESARIEGTFGYRYLVWEWLETSAVTIPANASATILTVKQFDTTPAASGTGLRVGVHTLPGASGSRHTERTMKTVSDQIADFTASRTPKAERMSVIMQKAIDEGRTLDEAEKTEYDALAVAVKDYDEHITRLEAFESSLKHRARPVDVSAAGQASSNRVTVDEPALPPGIGYAQYAMCLAAARGNLPQALAIGLKRYPGRSQLHAVLRSAVEAGTTTDSTWAGPLVYPTNFAGDFVDFLRPQTIVGKFGMGGIPSLRRVPFNISVVGQTTGGTGYWVGQGCPKPLTKFDFMRHTLRWAKVANIAVLTDELVRFSSPAAEALVRDSLAAALIERLDLDFIDPLIAAVPDVNPASITNGIVGLAPSGINAAAVRTDLQTLFGQFIAGNVLPTNGVFIMPTTIALALSLMRTVTGVAEFPNITMQGGTLAGLPVIASQYAVLGGSPDGNLFILVNASDIFLADDGQVTIDASREASLEMSSAPTQSGDSPVVAAKLVSMFQTNSVALRAERYINWSRRRNESVAYLVDVQYAA